MVRCSSSRGVCLWNTVLASATRGHSEAHQIERRPYEAVCPKSWSFNRLCGPIPSARVGWPAKHPGPASSAGTRPAPGNTHAPILCTYHKVMTTGCLKDGEQRSREHHAKDVRSLDTRSSNTTTTTREVTKKTQWQVYVNNGSSVYTTRPPAVACCALCATRRIVLIHPMGDID